MKRLVSILCLGVIVLAADSTFGQAGTSQLGGIVRDPSGALIPGVTVTATNTDTGVLNSTITNESGAYNFPSLQPGNGYRVSAALPGFQTRTVTGLVLGVAVVIRQDFTLEVAGTATTVEVSVEANELLNTASQSVGEVLSSTRVRDLPIVGNDVLSLITLMPGVRGTPNNPVFAGVDENRINTVRDGLSTSDGRFESGVFSTTFINPDLVGEIRIILAPVDAEMGRGNGQVQISTRSGTNRYTGTAQWDIRNTALNPNTWGNNNDVDPITGLWSPTKPNWSNTHHLSASFGGPIIRNKTFFFALWDQQLQYQRNIVTASVMTDAARNGVFRYFPGWVNGNADANTNFGTPTTASRAVVDFQGNPLTPDLNQNQTPYTGQLTCFSVFGNIKADGSPFGAADCPNGNAVINTPWDTDRPVMDGTGYIAKILAKMPVANYFASGDGLNTAGYRFLRTRRGNSGAAVTIGTDTNTNRKQLNLKIDQNFNANHKVSGNWSYERNDTFNDQPNWPDGLPYYTQRYPQLLTINATSTLSPNLLNEGRFGIRYSRANIAAPHETDFYPNQSVVQEALQYTIPIAGYNVTLDPGAGAYQFGGSANGIFDTTPGQYNGNTSSLYNYADTVSWSLGKHAFKFGGEWRATKTIGYNNIPRIPFMRVVGGAAQGQNSDLGGAANTPLLPSSSLLAGNRTNAVNMLYFLSGSVSSVQTLYWIDDASDVDTGNWENVVTKKRKFRDVKQNEAAFFWKDDWKVGRTLTLNLGMRWDWYGSPFIGSGFTSTAIGQGAGLFGIGRGSGGLFDNWLSPGAVYLSGYGPNAGTAGLQCTSGVSNGLLLPASSCDPANLTTIEFIGPNTPNPDRAAYRNDFNNFGPAVGFSWNVPWFGEGRATTVRGGYQLTYGGSGREIGGGGNTSAEVIIGGAPGQLNSATTIPGDFTDTYFNLADIPNMVPVRATIPPGGTIPVYDGSTAFTAVDPNWVTPYTQNFTLSVTTNATRRLTLDLRYIGTVSKKQQGTVNLNTNNVYYNKELWDALEITRAGGDAPLFDLMLAGLNLNNNAQGPTGFGSYAPVGTLNSAGVLQRGSAHLRRNTTFQDNIANGNFAAVAASLTGNGSSMPAVGATGGFLFLPDTDPNTTGRQSLTGVNDRRLLRNGCDRLAAGLVNIPTRCFPENYFEINPQLSNPTLVTNNATSNYHSLQTQMTMRPTSGISWQGTYTWSKNLGYGGDNFAYADPLCRACEYALTNSDVTHEFRTNGTFELPIGPNKLLLGNSGGFLARMIERWQTSVIFNWNSGTPSTISGATMFYGQAVPDIVGPFDFGAGKVRWNDDLNASGQHGGTYFDNPSPFVTVDDPQCQIVNVTDSMGFNSFNNNDCTISALALRNPDGTPGQILFQAPLPGHRGTLGRQVIRGVGSWSFDANLSKTFRLTESKSLQVRVDTTNVLNHPVPGQPTLNSQSGNFGDIGAKTGGRSFQGTMRLTF